MPSKYPHPRRVQMVLRLPKALARQLRAEAAANDRPINSEAVRRLQQSFPPRAGQGKPASDIVPISIRR